jgi:preprotein translocase subunit SecD
MLYFANWKVALICAVCALGVLLSLPNLFTPAQLAALPRWVPHKQVALGLDLRGGSYLLLEVDVAAAEHERLNSIVETVRNALRNAKIGYTGLNVEGDAISFTVRDMDRLEDARQTLAKLDPDLVVNLAGDGVGTMKYNTVATETRRRQAVEQSIEIIRRRIDETGTKEPTIQREGQNRILVQLPGVDNPEHVKQLLGRTAKLTFQLVDTAVSVEEARRGRLPPGDEVLPAQDEKGNRGGAGAYVVRKRVMVGGDTLTDAQATFQNNEPVVSFKFDAAGARRFGDATRENVGKPFAIVLDNKVISAPVIREPILGGSGEISGNFTTQEAKDLALLLRAGALPAPLQVVEQRSVGPDLGADSIAAGKIACAIGLVLVLVFMVAYYGLFGLFANIALIFNLAQLVALMSLLGGTLTLPGIAGIVLTMGMAVDANILIYERIREEQRLGRGPIASVDAGFQRALTTIIDSNMTHVIATAIMFQFGAGPIRGFAVTLLLGVLTTMFTATMTTRLIVTSWLRRTRPVHIPV